MCTVLLYRVATQLQLTNISSYHIIQCCLYRYIAHIAVTDTERYVEIGVACGPSFKHEYPS